MSDEAQKPEEFKDAYNFKHARFQSVEELMLSGGIGDECDDGFFNDGIGLHLTLPVSIRLFCLGDDCQKEMVYTLILSGSTAGNGLFILKPGTAPHVDAVYKCKYCGTKRTFFLSWHPKDDSQTTRFVKSGEWPPPGPPIPKSLLKMAGDAGSLMLKGYRCELEGMGIGAVTYYRRVVELRHKEILTSILDLAKANNNDPLVVESLEKAIRDRSFTSSVRDTNILVPPGLFISGRNPLLVLHNLLSIGVHALPDPECMAQAKMIRELLAHIATEIPHLLKQTSKLGETLASAEKAIKAARAAANGLPDDGNVF